MISEQKTFKFSVGIQGAGKSTYFKDKSPVVETDSIRKELFSDVNNISDEKLIFDTAIERIVNYFKNHNTVYFDATMVETKHRVPFLKKIKKLVKNVDLVGIIFTVEPEIAKQRIKKDIENNINRADSSHFVDEYYEYWKDTLKLIENGSVLFKPEYLKNE